MNRFKKELLRLAYLEYVESKDSDYEFQARNGDDYNYYSNAAEELQRDGFIELIDSTGFLRVHFQLTSQGLTIARQSDTEK